MVTRKPHHARLYRLLCVTAGCVAWLLPVGLLIAGSVWQTKGAPTPLETSSGTSPLVTFDEPFTLPNILSNKDIELYRAVFNAQDKADWASADAALARIHNKVLLGHVQAQRYLNRRYTSSPAELAEWLNRYSDLPQAADIYALAMAKAPDLKDRLQPVRRQQELAGYGDDNGLAAAAARDSDNAYTTTWQLGLAAWRNGHKQEAARLFSALAAHEEKISAWTASGAAYWAYRAYDALGHGAEANRYLQMAANAPRSFYGILARKQLGRRLELDSHPVALSDSDMLEMIGDQPVRRIVALSQAGQIELAEKELRVLFPQSDEQEKLRLLALAHQLNFASVQISMAKKLSGDDRTLDFAKYPIPHWEPEGGFTVDPSLIFALMRQESGFRPSAVSPGGALGLMQLMPQTAQLMQKNTGRTGLTLTEPVLNITLGQDYVQHLLENNLVDNNLIYLLAAYNAGPGRLQNWKASLNHQGDPLLFVESIPFAQTRHYVMQVMTSYWIYCELAGKPSRSVAALAHGQWPSYEQRSAPIADASYTRPSS